MICAKGVSASLDPFIHKIHHLFSLTLVLKPPHIRGTRMITKLVVSPLRPFLPRLFIRHLSASHTYDVRFPFWTLALYLFFIGWRMEELYFELWRVTSYIRVTKLRHGREHVN